MNNTIEQNMNVRNISYTLENGYIEFSFLYKDKGFIEAQLQLPTTPDCKDFINNKEFDSENEEHEEIFTALKEYFYDDFKDVLCAKASIICEERIFHVEEVKEFYVAFAEDKTYILKEGSYSNYYNVFYFQKTEGFADGIEDESEIIAEAKENFFESLSTDLEKKLNALNYDLNDSDITTDFIKQACDDAVNEFMREEFETFWDEVEIAQEFYETKACDIRVNREKELCEMKTN